MRTILCLFLMMYSSLTFGQVADNFSDGDFNSNPIWTGDTGSFRVNTQHLLQLNAVVAGHSMLTTNTSLNALDTIEWDLYIELSFSPSSLNYARYYLWSDQSDLTTTTNAYYLQFGETGSADAICLYKQQGSTAILLGRGVNGRVASSFGASVKVLKYPNGQIEVYTDFTGGNNYQLEFTANDNLIINQGFIGWQCNYTISNATGFYLDNIYAGSVIKDTTPPYVINAHFLNDTLLQVDFSEQVLVNTSSQNLHILSPNYQINYAQLNIDSTQLLIAINHSVSSGDTLFVLIIQAEDLSINQSDSILVNAKYIVYSYPTAGEIVINEIMCNPTNANGLPPIEYVELYNITNKYFLLNNVYISDPSTNGLIANDTLFPDAYKVYTSSNGKAMLSSIGIESVAVNNFPTLNNDGDDITLKDSLTVIDELNYNSIYYHDTFKENGGWSIEKIQSDYLCNNNDNWKASCNAIGGSPGMINCNIGVVVLDDLPEIQKVFIDDSNRVVLIFNKEINTAELRRSDFKIDGLLVVDNLIAQKHFSSEIILRTSLTFLENQIHYLSVDSIIDCAGKFYLSKSNIAFGKGSSPVKDDLIFNEVMFNPLINCYDFIELYNRSEKIISLKGLTVCRRNIVTGQLEYNAAITNQNISIMPHDFCVLIQNENAQQCYSNIIKQKVVYCNMPVMNDDEGILELNDAAVNKIDALHYYAEQHSPLLTNKEGVSLERVNENTPTNEWSNWKSASFACGYSTPTLKNSQSIEDGISEKLISLHPAVISPDNDGFEDYTLIEINAAENGSWGSLFITDMAGQLKKQIINTSLVGTNDKVIWDGTDDAGKVMFPGLYLLFAEIVAENGTIKKSRLPLVIAAEKN